MKVLSLMQPWATLVAIGVKKFETRSLNWKYRGEFLIHASKNMNSTAKQFARSKLVLDIMEEKKVDELPLGKIIGLSHINRTFKTEVADDLFFEDTTMYPMQKMATKDWQRIWADNVAREKALGDYSPGRWMYELLDSVSFPAAHHFPAKGSLIKGWEFDHRICTHCGCTEHNCQACINKTGTPCYWVANNLCSACAISQHNNKTIGLLTGTKKKIL